MIGNLIFFLFLGSVISTPLEEIQQERGQVVFLGDSITDFWKHDGASVWNEYYEPLGAVNTGISGHQTTDVIARINNEGIIDNLNAKVAILLIGTNDLAWGGKNEEEVAFNVGLILNLIKSKNPNCRIILLAILPRGDSDVNLYTKLQNANRMLSQYNNEGERVWFFNMEGSFATDASTGQIIEHLFTDKLHLAGAGYQMWAQTMDPLFSDLLNRP